MIFINFAPSLKLKKTIAYEMIKCISCIIVLNEKKMYVWILRPLYVVTVYNATLIIYHEYYNILN